MKTILGEAVEFKTVCPFCGARHEAASAVGHDHGPGENSVTLCASCGEWSMFEPKAPGGLRKPTAEEHLEIGMEPAVRAIRDVWVKTASPEARAEQEKAEAEAKANPPPLPRLEKEWQDIEEGFFNEETDPRLISHMKSIFYMGAIAVFQVFDEARQSRDVEAIHRIRDELNEFANKYLDDHGLPSRPKGKRK